MHMNEKIQAILLKIVLDLKKKGWIPSGDWEITLKSDGTVPLEKSIPVHGAIGDREFDEHIDAHITLKLESRDQITYFPGFVVYANIFIDGGDNKDLTDKFECDSAFTDKDYRNGEKSSEAARKIDSIVDSYITEEFDTYMNNNHSNIMAYKAGGWKEPEDND